jgi:hypothetical protein
MMEVYMIRYLVPLGKATPPFCEYRIAKELMVSRQHVGLLKDKEYSTIVLDQSVCELMSQIRLTATR